MPLGSGQHFWTPGDAQGGCTGCRIWGLRGSKLQLWNLYLFGSHTWQLSSHLKSDGVQKFSAAPAHTFSHPHMCECAYFCTILHIRTYAKHFCTWSHTISCKCENVRNFALPHVCECAKFHTSTHCQVCFLNDKTQKRRSIYRLISYLIWPHL